MKNLFRFLIVFYFLIFSTSLAVIAEPIEILTPNVTSIPMQMSNTSSQVVEMIPAGGIIQKISSSGYYYYVNYNNIYGWINKAYTVQGAYELANSSTSSNLPLQNSSYKDVIETCKAFCRDNNFSYGGVGRMPITTSTRQVDCSGYVTWVLYEYGKLHNIPDLVNSFSSQVSSYGFNDIGQALASGKTNPHFVLVGNDIRNAPYGDILCYNGHVEIYAGTCSVDPPRAYVYDCGTVERIRSESLTTRSGHSLNSITYILRLKYL